MHCAVAGFGDSSSVLLQDVKDKLVRSLQSPTRQVRQPLQRRPYQHSVVTGAPETSFVEQKQLALSQKYTVLPPISAYATQPSENTQRVWWSNYVHFILLLMMLCSTSAGVNKLFYYILFKRLFLQFPVKDQHWDAGSCSKFCWQKWPV